MGNKSSKGDVSDHVAFSTAAGPVPNIVVTSPTPLISPESPKPFAPPPSPMDGNYSYSYTQSHRESPLTPHASETDMARGETGILAGTPPPDHPPPPPPVEENTYEDIKSASYAPFPTISDSPRLPMSPPPMAAPRSHVPTIKRNIIYAKDRIAQYEALNTTDREKDSSSTDYYSIKGARPSEFSSRFKPFTPTPLSEQSTATTAVSSKRGSTIDEYPVYNPVSDYNFKSGTTFQRGTFPIDANRINIGFCGRQGAGKSTLINALRGISVGDPQSAGRNICDNMEPFRFIEENLQNIVLWEIPFPRTFSNVSAIYEKNMGFDQFYETHKLNLFHRIFVLIPDGSAHDVDIYFSRIVQSRKTPLTFLSTKSDDDLDADSRESGLPMNDNLKREYESRARRVFTQSLQSRAQILCSVEHLFISSHVVRNIVSGTTGYLHYKMDEDTLLSLVDIKAGCHYALENKMRKEKEEQGMMDRSMMYETSRSNLQERPTQLRGFNQSPSMKVFPPTSIEKSTVMVDAGFDILYGVDDRVFGNAQPSTTVRRSGKTAFNYGFIGNSGVGKSSMINAMRGMSSKHPLAAGKSRTKPGSCEKFEFEDDLLKYSVTLWELHYPKKINSFFEFIDRHNISAFTAIFVLIDGVPKDDDLAFSKIAHRRNATVIFLSSKSDKILSGISRSDEIPVCDLLKQRFVDKGLARFDRSLAAAAPELCGRVHVFFVSAPVFRALRCGDNRLCRYVLHERAVFDFLKQKRIIADLLDSPGEMKEGLYANVNTATAGVDIVSEQ